MKCKCNKECECCKRNWLRSLIWATALVLIVFLNSCEKDVMEDNMLPPPPPVAIDLTTNWSPEFNNQHTEDFVQKRLNSSGDEETRTIDVTEEIYPDLDGYKYFEGNSNVGDINGDGDTHDYVVNSYLVYFALELTNEGYVHSNTHPSVYQDLTGNMLVDYEGIWIYEYALRPRCQNCTKSKLQAIKIDSTGVELHELNWGVENDYNTCWEETPDSLLPYFGHPDYPGYNIDLEFTTSIENNEFLILADNPEIIDSYWSPISYSRLSIKPETLGGLQAGYKYGADIKISLTMSHDFGSWRDVTDPVTGVVTQVPQVNGSGKKRFIPLKIANKYQLVQDFGEDFEFTNRCN